MVSVTARVPCPRMVDRALSASNTQRGLKQPVVCTVTLPFFKSSRSFNDNFCLFLSAYNILGANERCAFSGGGIDYPEKAFLEWV